MIKIFFFKILIFFLCILNQTNSYILRKIYNYNNLENNINNNLKNNNIDNKNRYNPFIKKRFVYHKLLNDTNNQKNIDVIIKRYPIVRPDFIKKIKLLNSKNSTIQNNAILQDDIESYYSFIYKNNSSNEKAIKVTLNRSNFLQSLGIKVENEEETEEQSGYFDDDDETNRRKYVETTNGKSKNFQVIKNFNIKFQDVGGYENVKQELFQCVDILKNYNKYKKYNIRIPKGLILEGPPGTGKTLIAKALAGESECSFIPVSGSDFQEKYVGIGSARIKELFELAKKNIPCIIFIDEIDAVGRKRSSDGDSSSGERDNTLNSLLVELDGFKNNTCVFLVGATNRIDLLDNALIRPGRIDKKIHIGLPDKITREAIIKIHINGKPYCDSIGIKEIVEVTEGLSGAQIENLLNEAMLNALRNNNTEFCYNDFDFVMNKMIAGWQPIEHEFTSDIIDHIAIHEMGHTIVGLLSKYHSKVSKVVINLSSPKSPGYTVFEGSTSNIYIREALFEHLMILLGGRIAEEIFYDVSVTTGAINDFEEALKLAEKMIIYYGMGSNIIYPSLSEKYKELIDNEVVNLLNQAYKCAQIIIQNSKEFISETSELLKKHKIIKVDELNNLIETKYKYLENIQIEFE